MIPDFAWLDGQLSDIEAAHNNLEGRLAALEGVLPPLRDFIKASGVDADALYLLSRYMTVAVKRDAAVFLGLAALDLAPDGWRHREPTLRNVATSASDIGSSIARRAFAQLVVMKPEEQEYRALLKRLDPGIDIANLPESLTQPFPPIIELRRPAAEGEGDQGSGPVLALCGDWQTDKIVNSAVRQIDATMVLLNLDNATRLMNMAQRAFIVVLLTAFDFSALLITVSRITTAAGSWREDVLAVCRKRGIATAIFFPDLIRPEYQRICASLGQSVDLVASIDFMSAPEASCSVFRGWTPMPALPAAEIERDIDISFVGRLRGPVYLDRKNQLVAMAGQGLQVYVPRGRRENIFADENLSYEEYTRILQRSRISLNFSRNGTFNVLDFSDDAPFDYRAITEDHHLKGRVLEIIRAGALLLESANPVTASFLEPGVHYVPFESPEDAVEKARYYLDHDDERVAITSAALAFFNEHGAEQHFWKEVLERLNRQGG